ncbi:NUDIX domain-containing protein [Phycisphaera mikurensis]|uniref:Nudix hydrolase domain-containing protein n=1 Tax=Phycisphaera mikurensis (strain NBRC 102666 / KCTC 22515 / FYK2301M01) TaxID=1142394 RepID=I0IIW8_PHYMF|nr:NUDIX domain-containing protein [Phycisphaera mikurensis]MBB6443371.1 8-oxo-dGTP diphosphatase [Phycisphaera mikurensis]BAM05206.1 hypothetical protein PSMK_30470 [Phycisphaera mikurensis NBRC 102666]
MPHASAFARPALAVDVVVFASGASRDGTDLREMRIERDTEPSAGRWALPGGFVHVDETIEEAARREPDERDFRKKILGMGILAGTGAIEKDVKLRAAEPYRFDAEACRRLSRGGFHFES